MAFEDTTLTGIGERKLIDLMMKILGTTGEDILPYPEDAVAVNVGGNIIVLKTDSFVASTDMPPQMNHYNVGYKTAIMNFSDLAAKGAKPLYFLTSLCLPGDLKVRKVLDLTKGIKDAAVKYNVGVLGGDINKSNDLAVNGFVIGLVEKSQIMYRKGCLPGDLLAVTGPFGLTSVALKVLLENKEAKNDLKEKALNSMFKPQAKIKEGLALAKSGAVTSSIDSSDGLLESLKELSRVNGFGFTINELPVAEGIAEFAETNELSLEDLVLKGGEEFELVVTIKPDKLDQAKDSLNRVGAELFVIGVVVQENKIFLQKDNKKIEIKGRGYEHFTI